MTVQRGPTFDGLGQYYREIIEESDEPSRSTWSQALRDARVDVVVSYLPVGSEQADKFYAQAAIDAGCAFVNALPVFIASDPEWAQKFTDAGLPIVGDDIKSQVGATIVHRALAKLFEDRGVELLRTYQLNFGGNMDFMNMLERNRLVSKKISKTQSVTSPDPARDGQGRRPHRPVRPRAVARRPQVGLHPPGGPRRSATRRSTPSSSSRCGTRRTRPASSSTPSAPRRSPWTAGIGGPILSASCYFMKSPPVQYADHDAHEAVEAFIARRRSSADSQHRRYGGPGSTWNPALRHRQSGERCPRHVPALAARRARP